MHTKTMSADATCLNEGYTAQRQHVQHFYHVYDGEHISSSGLIQISGYQQPGWSYSSDAAARPLKIKDKHTQPSNFNQMISKQ